MSHPPNAKAIQQALAPHIARMVNIGAAYSTLHLPYLNIPLKDGKPDCESATLDSMSVLIVADGELFNKIMRMIRDTDDYIEADEDVRRN